MDYIFVPLLFLHLITLIICIAILVYTWDIKDVPGAHYFIGYVILAEIWVIFQGMEIISTRLELKLIWANIQFLPIMLIPAIFLLYVKESSRRHDKKARPAVDILLIGVALVFSILVWVFPELLRYNVRLVDTGYFQVIAKDYGILFWIMVAYNYALTLIAVLILFKSMHEKTEVLRKQIKITLLAVVFPVIANILQITKLNPFPIDITPFSFCFTAILLSYGIVRYKLFKLVPIARAMVIRVMKSGMVVFDNKGNLLDMNPAAKQLLALGEMPLAGEKIEDVFAKAPQLISLFNSRRDQVSELGFERNGVNYFYETSLTAIKNSGGNEIGWLFQLYDITERKLAEDIIEQAAFHDVLTGLPNRQYFRIMLSQELALAKMRNMQLAIAFVDVDNFKTINDSYGHEYGDTVLRGVTKRLREALREGDIIARLGGDEFAIILPSIDTKNDITAVGERLLAAFESELDLISYKISVHVSIGFSLFPDDGDSYETLLRKADKAMYDVKNSGKNNYGVYKDVASQEAL